MESPLRSPGDHRARPISRSPAPSSHGSRTPSRHRRSPSGSRDDRSPSPRRSSRYRDDSRSPSRSRGRSLSRDRESRSRSRTPGESPPLRSTKIVVERLTKNVNEDHLHEIFGQYGEIKDLDLPINRKFGTNRGTAYILYVSEADAESAIAHMHESQIDGAIINVSIVLPRRKFSPLPPTARRGANFDPRGPPPGRAGPPGVGVGIGGRGGRRSPGPMAAPGAGRFRSDTYRPRSASRSRSRSPLPAPGGSRRYRSRSASYSSRSESRSPRGRGRGRGGRGGGRRHDDHDSRRRSPSRASYDSYDRRSLSRGRSRSREWSRR